MLLLTYYARNYAGIIGASLLCWSIADFILNQRLQWLGHLGHMSVDRLLKQLLFRELLKKRPFHSAKKRWRDEVMSDLWAISVEDWYVVQYSVYVKIVKGGLQ